MKLLLIAGMAVASWALPGAVAAEDAVKLAEENFAVELLDGYQRYLEHCEVLDFHAASALAEPERAAFRQTLASARTARERLLSLQVLGAPSDREAAAPSRLVASYQRIYESMQGQVAPLGAVFDGYRLVYLPKGKGLSPEQVSAINGFLDAVRKLMYAEDSADDFTPRPERLKMTQWLLEQEGWKLAQARKNAGFIALIEPTVNRRLLDLQEAIDEARAAASGVVPSPFAPR